MKKTSNVIRLRWAGRKRCPKRSYLPYRLLIRCWTQYRQTQTWTTSRNWQPINCQSKRKYQLCVSARSRSLSLALSVCIAPHKTKTIHLHTCTTFLLDRFCVRAKTNQQKIIERKKSRLFSQCNIEKSFEKRVEKCQHEINVVYRQQKKLHFDAIQFKMETPNAIRKQNSVCTWTRAERCFFYSKMFDFFFCTHSH